MITATPLLAAAANPMQSPAPAAAASVEPRTGRGHGGPPGAFPRALQRSVGEPAPVPGQPARSVATPPAGRAARDEVNAGPSGAAGNDADELLTALKAHHALRTKTASQEHAPTPPEHGRSPAAGEARPPTPAQGGVVRPPLDGDAPVLAPPFHDPPGAPMPLDTAAEAAPDTAAQRWASNPTKTAWQASSATVPVNSNRRYMDGPRPTPGDVVEPPADGDGVVSSPPFHDRPGGPMPPDAASGADPAAAVRRSAPPFTEASSHGLPATPAAARTKPPLNGAPPALPRPRSGAGPGTLEPLPAPGVVVAPPADGDDAGSTPPFHDRPGAPMPRDTGAEAAPAMAGPAEARTPDLGAGFDLAARASLAAEADSLAGHRATGWPAGQQAGPPPGAAAAADAATLAAQPVPGPDPVPAAVAGTAWPRTPAADDEFAPPASAAGSTPLALALPMGQAAAASGLSAAAAPGTTAEAGLTAAPGSADFSSQLGTQLTTFVREGVQHARLHLHPAELGPVTVRIQIDGQAAQVHMAAEHALTRQALEQSMPMLAGSLREAGLTLSGGGVFEQPRQHEGGDAPGQPGAGTARAPGGDSGAEASRRSTAVAPARRGVVDLVA
jgi:flagellar hook-length control protein FliK